MPLNEEERSSTWEYVSPFEIVDRPWRAYTSPIAAVVYGPYSSLAAGKGILYPGVVPIGLAKQGGIIRTTATKAVNAATFGMAAKTPQWMRTGVGAAFFGEHFGGNLFYHAKQILAVPGATTWKEAAEKYSYEMSAEIARKAKRPLGFVPKGARALAGAPGTGRFLGFKYRAAGTAIRAGRIISPIMGILTTIELGVLGVEALYKGNRMITDVLDRASERVSNLELGGDIARGFLTPLAATERQRAIMKIQGSELAGRRFLGGEAQFYHQ